MSDGAPLPAPGGTLLIHFGQMGDAVMALPAATALRLARGAANLTVLAARGGDAIFRLAGFERVWAVDRAGWRDHPARAARELPALLLRLRRARFALSVDLHSFKETNLLAWMAGIPRRVAMRRASRSWPLLINAPGPPDDYHAHLVDRYCRVLEALDITVSDRVPHLSPPEAARRSIAEAWQAWAPAPASVLGICPGAGHPDRRWPPERFAALARVPMGRTPTLLTAVFAGPEENEATLAPFAALAGARVWRGLTIAELAAALARCHVVVSNPTGPSHIAAAVGARVVTLGEVAPFDPRGDVVAVRARARVSDITLAEALDAVGAAWLRAGA